MGEIVLNEAMVVETEPALCVECVDSARGLEALADGWNALGCEVPFLTHAWAVAWWQHYQKPSGQLFTLVVRDTAGAVVGLAPWHCQNSAGRGRVIRVLGSGEVCADYVTLVARPADRSMVTAAIVNWLCGPGAAEWDLLELTGADEADAALNDLREQMATRGHATHQAVRWQGWRTELPPTWDEFLVGLSRTRRETIRTQWRKLVAPGRARLHRAESVADIARSFDILVDLHQKRREMLNQPGCFASTSFTAFHRQLAESFLAAGRLRLSWLELDETPIAVEYSFTGGDTIYYYQGGFDPSKAQLGPGWLMTAMSMQAGIAEGYRYFDFLRGDEPYKAAWNATPRPLIELRIAGRRPTARVRHVAWQTGQAVRRWAARHWSVGQRQATSTVERVATAGKTMSRGLPAWGGSLWGARLGSVGERNRA
jgi:CelD/BcsL family acetyltransferase involved in cellulose biosynthesis